MEVTFKSTNEFYQKEKSGYKNNTVRKVDWNDERFKLLKEYSEYKHPIAYLQIKNVDEVGKQIGRSQDDSFCVLIKDVTFWEDLCIITWYL